MKFDYIIVGAGSAGCVVANRLTEDPACKVLLLEAGGEGNWKVNIPGAYGTLHRTKVDWAFWTERQSHVIGRRLYIPRGKVLGGSSTTNAMAYVRGNAEDYNEWASLGNVGWSFSDVLPYFKKSEHNENFDEGFHGKNGLLNVSLAKYPSPLSTVFINACTEHGIPYNEDYNGKEQLGTSLLQFTIKNNKRHSAAAAFLMPAMKRQNLTVRTNVLVSRVIIEKDHAAGIELFTGSNNIEKVYCNNEVVLCAGAIKSPQILLLSGVGEQEILKSQGIAVRLHLPGVGKNLQDHVWTWASGLCNVVTSNSYIKPLNMLGGLFQYLVFDKGPFCNSPIEANAFLRTDTNLSRPDIQFHFAPVHSGNDYTADPYNVKTFPHTNGFTILAILLHPRSRGYVTIKTGNAYDAPVIHPDVFSVENDRNTLLHGLKKAMAVADAAAFRPFSPKGLYHPLRDASDDTLIGHMCKSLETLYHPVGTCRMGNDEMAVVNDRLQLHGLTGLRIIDASIMPTIVSGNTNAACIMIGEKGADLIKASA